MDQRTPNAWDLITLGSLIVGCVVGGLVIGLVIDAEFHTTPLYAVVGTGVGIVGACLTTYLRIRTFLKG